MELEKAYDHTKVEQNIYDTWIKSGYFNPDNLKGEPYTIIMPPPNVTGTLHMGHALMTTIEDILIRYKRMQGFKTLWLPGTDHAAIATQSKVEKLLEKEEGKKKRDLGREEFLKRVQAFAQQSHDTIVNQLKSMGASCDWSREAFTLDEQRNLAVRTAFKAMYDLGLIYRAHRVINWDVKGQTTISDDEIVYQERPAKLYTFKYSKDFPISISTTRPETKVGDTAVAVHPDDERYQQYIGKEYTAEFCGVPITIKIVGDKSVEKDFGTGALGVTPAHSMVDAEIAQRHNLPMKQIIDEFGKMTVGGENLMGKKVAEAREVIVSWLKEKGLLEKEEDITQNVGTAERTGGIIEPLPKLQWFISVDKKFKLPHSELTGISSGEEVTLKQLMRHVVESGQIKITPDHFNKTYFHWIENLRDWCISRQIWYGHRIPVWYGKNDSLHLSQVTQVLFARHGQAEISQSGMYKDNRTTPLTELGKKQAEQLGHKLKNVGVKKIICSNLQRSIETAQIIAREIGYPEEKIEAFKELNEVNLGDLNKINHDPDSNRLAISIEKGLGETLEQIDLRAQQVVKKLKEQSDGPILVVGHNIMNIMVQTILSGKTKESFIEERGKIGVRENGSVVSHYIVKNPVGENLTQDPDTLDTWFSSGLWTFSTLGWPNQTEDLKTFHPTDVLETGYDILFFWVARMILMTTSLTGQIPFKDVFLHGIIRDADKQKMSKSKGNVIDPLDMTAKYGTDALRFALVFNTAPGTDMSLAEDKIKGMKHFGNKLWNIARFILSYDNGSVIPLSQGKLVGITDADKDILTKLNQAIQNVTNHLENFRLHEAAQEIYQFTWKEFADVYIEVSKAQLADEKTKATTLNTLYFILTTILRLLHPFMPFLTEELWSKLEQKDLLMITQWPK